MGLKIEELLYFKKSREFKRSKGTPWYKDEAVYRADAQNSIGWAGLRARHCPESGDGVPSMGGAPMGSRKTGVPYTGLTLWGLENLK